MSKINELKEWIFEKEGFIAPDTLSSSSKIGEAIAWELAQGRIDNKKQKNIVTSPLKQILSPILHTELRNLKLWELDVHIADKAPSKHSEKKYKAAIRHGLLSYATVNELISPKLKPSEHCPVKKWIRSRFETPKEISKDLKIGEFIAHLIAENKISCAEISRKSAQKDLVAAIKHIANIALKDFNSKHLFSAATKIHEKTDEKDRKAKEEGLRSGIKVLFLDPAIEKNLLEYNYTRRDRDDRETFVVWLSEKSDSHTPSVPTEETNFGQYLGWLIKNKRLNVDDTQSIVLFKQIIEKLIETKLKDINTEKILDILSSQNKTPADKFGSTRSSFRKVFMTDAIDLGVCEFAHTYTTISDFKDWLDAQAKEVPKVSSKMTFGQFAIWLEKKGKLDEESLRLLSKPYAKKVISEIFKIKLSELRWKDIKSATKAYQDETEIEHSNSGVFRQIFLDPAVKMGILPKEYNNRSDTKYIISRQLESSKHTKKEDRTIGHYIAELCKDKPVETTTPFNIFLDIWETKASCLAPKNIPNLSQKEMWVLRDICDMMIKDGLLQFDFYSFQEKQKNTTTISMKDDKWKVNAGPNSFIHLNFKKIENEHLKTLAKKHIKWRIENGYKMHDRALRGLVRGLFSFLLTTDRTLKNFTNRSKKEWLLWLKRGFSDNEGRLIFYAGKQFLDYCLEIHPKSLYSNLNLTGLKNPFETSIAHVNHYQQWEIDQIIKGIKGHNNRQFSDILTLIMLTAKRRGEILSLKRNCLLDIAGIKYLKYTDHKNNVEKRVPLQSFNIEGAPSLFHKDIETIITEILERQLAYSEDMLPFCHPDERDFLLIKERSARSNKGYKYGAVTVSLYTKDKKAFVTSHEIQFSLDAHRFRHTIASAIIRSGKGIDAAARVLGNHPKTTAKHYETSVSKEETLRLPKSPKVSALEDAKELALLNKTPTVLTEEERAIDDGCAMPGGKCLAGLEKKLSCKYYQRLFGNGGCLGCGSLGIGEEDRFFYEDTKYEILKEIEEVRGTPIATGVSAKLNLVTNTLRKLDTIGAT